MARRADHTHGEIRDMAVAAARRLIERDGLDNLKIRGIAREIGYAPGTLYNVFDGLDELMMQVNAGTIDSLVAELQRAEPDDGPADLMSLLSAYGAFAQRNANLWKAVFDYSLSDPDAAPEWYVGKINEGLRVVERAVAALSPAGAEESPADIARILWAGLHGIFSLGAEGNLRMVSQSSPEQLAQVFVRMIERAARS